MAVLSNNPKLYVANINTVKKTVLITIRMLQLRNTLELVLYLFLKLNNCIFVLLFEYHLRKGIFMIEYQFVRIDFKKISGSPKEDYKDVIKKHSKDGWRFVQIFYPDFITSGVGVGSYFELIFEKELKSS